MSGRWQVLIHVLNWFQYFLLIIMHTNFNSLLHLQLNPQLDEILAFINNNNNKLQDNYSFNL